MAVGVLSAWGGADFGHDRFRGAACPKFPESLLDLGDRQQPARGVDVAAVQHVDFLAGQADLGQGHESGRSAGRVVH